MRRNPSVHLDRRFATWTVGSFPGARGLGETVRATGKMFPLLIIQVDCAASQDDPWKSYTEEEPWQGAS